MIKNRIILVAAVFTLSLISLATRQRSPIRTVVILGNSIVRHPPLPAVGWAHDWGMAASVADSDFVHRLTYSIHRAQPNVNVYYLNIAGWERDYRHYDIARLDSLRNPDLLILRLGENVEDHQDDEIEFTAKYDQLINCLDKDHKAIKVITDSFWSNQYVNQWIKKYATKKQYKFVSLHDLSIDSTNMALSEFTNEGVGRHPSDKGMALISNRIWIKINKYF